MGAENQTKAVPASSSMTGVNDDIADIMSEIESLQQGMATAAQPKSTRVAAAPHLKPVPVLPKTEEKIEEEIEEKTDEALSEFRAAATEESASMEETLGSMSFADQEAEAAPEAQSTMAIQAAADAAMAAIASESGSYPDPAPETGQNENIDEERTMVSDTDAGSDGSLTLSLQGNMRLKLKYEFEGQEVTVSFREHCLYVQLSDGTEFKVPVNRTLHRAA